MTPMSACSFPAHIRGRRMARLCPGTTASSTNKNGGTRSGTAISSEDGHHWLLGGCGLALLPLKQPVELLA